MALCGVATLLLLGWLLVRLGVSTTRLWVALLIFALSPLALGPISLNTYDAWPALLTLAALALLLAGRDVAAFALLGAAFAAKVYPVVLVPPAAIFVWRTRGRELALRALVVFAAVAASSSCPSLCLRPTVSRRAFAHRRLGRCRSSLGGSFLAVADRLGLYSATVASHRARDLVRPRRLVAGDAGRAGSIAQALAVVAVAWLYLRVATSEAAHTRLRRGDRGIPRIHALLLAAVPRLARPVRRAARARRSGNGGAALSSRRSGSSTTATCSRSAATSGSF